MKILITTDWYTPAVNGVVTSVLNLKRELERRGHNVLVLTMSMTHRTYQEGNVIYIASVNAGKIYPNARIRLIFKDKWLQKILDWKPDIVHSQCEFNTFLTAKKISDILHIPIVHTYHTIYEDYTHYFSPSKGVGKTAVKTFTCILCDGVQHIIAPTEKTAAILRRYGVKPNITVVPSGLELRERKYSGTVTREDMDIPQNQTVVLYLGRLAKEKNLDEIISAFTQYRGEAITFLVVGDGPYRWELEAQTRALPANIHTRFVGMVPPELVWDYYTLADIYVSASESETQGLTYAEAAASGLPLLCKRDDCLAGLVEDGVNGWQFTDKADFLQKFDLFMKADYIDRSVMAMFSKVAAERFDIHSTVPRILEVYDETIKSFTSPMNTLQLK